MDEDIRSWRISKTQGLSKDIRMTRSEMRMTLKRSGDLVEFGGSGQPLFYIRRDQINTIEELST